jgi:hypothetical protein
LFYFTINSFFGITRPLLAEHHRKFKLQTCEVIHRFACQNHAVSLWNSSFAGSGFANDPLTIAVHVGIGAFDSLLNGTAMLKETSAMRIASIPESKGRSAGFQWCLAELELLVAEIQRRMPEFQPSAGEFQG